LLLVEGVTTEADFSAALRNDNRGTGVHSGEDASGEMSELVERLPWRFEQNAGVLRCAQNDNFYFRSDCENNR
jgi:hypothetical protein